MRTAATYLPRMTSLSRTGNGNVLLVDMNLEEGVARSFCNGKPGCGLMESLDLDAKA